MPWPLVTKTSMGQVGSTHCCNWGTMLLTANRVRIHDLREEVVGCYRCRFQISSFAIRVDYDGCGSRMTVDALLIQGQRTTS